MFTAFIEPDEFLEAVGGMDAFVGADGQRMGQACEDAVLAGGQGLLDERDAELGRRAYAFGEVFGRPTLVGVEDDAAFAAPTRPRPGCARCRHRRRRS